MDDTSEAAAVQSESGIERWFLLLAGTLLVFASWWISATASLRILILWVIAQGVLGPWGQRRLSDCQRMILAALIGVGVVHLVIFPIASQPLFVVAAKIFVLLLAYVSLTSQILGGKGTTRPFDKWNRYVAAGVAVSGTTAILHACHALGTRAIPATAAWVFSPLGYVLIFGFLASRYRDPGQRQPIVRLLAVLPVIIVAVATTQFLFLGIAKQRAQRSFQRDDLASALSWNTASLGINERLRIGLADDRLLLQRAHLLEVLGRPADALGALLRRYRVLYPLHEDAVLQRLCDTYFTTSSLEAQILAVGHPASLWRLDRLPLPENPDQRSFILGLFVRCRLLDRLLIEYAQHGLGEGLDFGYLLGSLESQSFKSDSNRETWASYLRGVCNARLGRRGAACEEFRHVLMSWPGYHNALVWLERLGGAGESLKGPQMATGKMPVPPAGKFLGWVENAQMLGNHRWGLNVDDALWTALEMRSGRYMLQFEVNGLPAEGEWPILTVHLDGELVVEQPVRARTWTTVKWERQFDRDACHRLVIGFPNDILKQLGNRTINRNLYFRRLTIERLPASH